MMWKLRHRLFGTHFVMVCWAYDFVLRPIRWTPNGQPYVEVHSSMIFLLDTDRAWRALTFDKQQWLAQYVDAAGNPLPKLRSVA